MAPFSGPIHRSWLSPVTCRQNHRMSPNISSASSPTTRGRSASMAVITISVPRPMVKVRPYPARPVSVTSRT